MLVTNFRDVNWMAQQSQLLKRWLHACHLSKATFQASKSCACQLDSTVVPSLVICRTWFCESAKQRPAPQVGLSVEAAAAETVYPSTESHL